MRNALILIWGGLVLAYLAWAGPNWDAFKITDIYPPSEPLNVEIHAWDQIKQERVTDD